MLLIPLQLLITELRKEKQKTALQTSLDQAIMHELEVTTILEL